jgi:hypothetical protein
MLHLLSHRVLLLLRLVAPGGGARGGLQRARRGLDRARLGLAPEGLPDHEVVIVGLAGQVCAPACTCAQLKRRGKVKDACS